MELIKSILGVESSGGTETPARIEEKSIKCQPGVRLHDKEGLKAARCTGWIFSYDTIKYFIGQDHYELDYAFYDAIDKKLERFCQRLVMVESKRKGIDVTQFSAEGKNELCKLVMQQLFGEERPTGLFVMRLHRKLNYWQPEVKWQNCVSAPIIPTARSLVNREGKETADSAIKLVIGGANAVNEHGCNPIGSQANSEIKRKKQQKAIKID